MITPYYSADGKSAAVLVSTGYGAGWSTWNSPELAWDSRVVEWWLEHKDHWDLDYLCRGGEADKFFESLGYEAPYYGGLSDIILVWVKLGRKWRIEEYDGAESIEYDDSIFWVTLK